MAFNTNYHDTGLFGVYAVTDRERSQDLSWVLMNEITKMCYEVKEADVARARNQLKASLLFLQDSSQRECVGANRVLRGWGGNFDVVDVWAHAESAGKSANMRAGAEQWKQAEECALLWAERRCQQNSCRVTCAHARVTPRSLLLALQ
jgi:processing peptidase subunit beta